MTRHSKMKESFKNIGYGWIQHEEMLDSDWLPSERVPLGYSWILKAIKLLLGDEGSSFLRTVGKELEDIEQFDKLPAVLYWLRFIKPIQYQHPSVCPEECEDSYWSMLLQILFVTAKDVEIIPGEDLPRIAFTYWGERRILDTMSIKELKYLTFDLAIAFASSKGTDILIRKIKGEINEPYADMLANKTFISRYEFWKIYCGEGYDFSHKIKDILFADELYKYIAHYNSMVDSVGLAERITR